MIESTARAERYDLQTSTSSFFLWEVPQKPVAVRIPYDLMDRLERQAGESFSTARAERYDLQTSTSSFFLGEVPQKPVAVRIPYDLMDRLERQAVESFRSVTSKGSEIGGLLIGSVAAGSPMVVSVAEYQLIECEYSRGPLYRLSETDL